MGDQKEMTDELDFSELAELEARFPSLSGEAFSAAADRSRKAGHTVTQAISWQVFQISPEGQKTMVKSLPAPMKVEVGSKIRIQ